MDVLRDILMTALTIVVGYIAVYSLVDRICECFENCARIKHGDRDKEEQEAL